MTRSRDHLRAAYEDACRLEIEALKPGNVHVFADGHRMSADQFLESASVSAGPLTDPGLPVGRRILEAIRATRNAVGTNTNLGIVLLAAPLIRAAGAPGPDLRANLAAVLDSLGMDDAASVFEAIALASPGGLGSAGNDVREKPKIGLLDAMREAAGRDMIARQYVTGFADIFETGLVTYENALAQGEGGMWPTIAAYMAFLAGFPDSHVARKHGMEIASEVRKEAAGLRAALLSKKDEAERLELLMGFDRRLKAHAVNPGTSADLTVACLLVHFVGHRLA
ncbi:MAG: triphosphoribosyl-dephospho-CoA synthase [Hyphomicrobiales bacterium]|nr:triphosphoribosyl-dephospho-CoA synthase [Hyphomicrobiales bacterium]